MVLKQQILILTYLTTIIVFRNSQLTKAHQTNHAGCNRTCGVEEVPYPFGFSSGCPIRLNCSKSGYVQINDFRVSVPSISDQGKLKLNLVKNCSQPIQALHELYTNSYAPTNQNAMLFYDCKYYSSCNLAPINAETRFDARNCTPTANNTSCFVNSTSSSERFFNYDNITTWGRCKNWLSSILVNSSSSVLSLEVQAVELEWWVKGYDCLCSKDANCSKVYTTLGALTGFRCRCNDGFVGDGYLHGQGCRRECNFAKYMSGDCSGPTRIAVLSAGTVICTALVTSLAILFCCAIRRRSNRKTKGYERQKLTETSGIEIPIYPYKEIERATGGFSDKQRLGTGAYGTVYAGKINNDSWVAIKRIKHRDKDSIGQVMNEIKLISSVDHPNLVRLLGCSIENGEQILVYEFMPNGTLCQHLQRERGDGLSWPVRLTIATETAQAIAHLHSAINPPIIHRDIKSSNILLDYNYRSKLADFGLSRLGMTEMSHISTAPQGTPGYVDPQYHQNFHLSDKSDVYSFGVVLVEIITALKVVDFSRPQSEVNLAALATDRIGKGRLVEIIDPHMDLHTDAWNLSSIHKVAELAFRCLAYEKDIRPSMSEVAVELEQIRLIRWEHSEETNCSGLLREESNCSSLSNVSDSEKPLTLEGRGLFVLQVEASCGSNLSERKENSPVCVQDPWLSEASSPSSNSLPSGSLVR